MTVDSSYNLVTGHPMSFSFGVFSNFLKIPFSNFLVSLGLTGPGPSTTQPQSHAPPTWNSIRACVSISDTPPLTHHQTTTWPSLWHPQHWSPGVLCAPLEWPCWALPSSPLGCMLHVSKCGIFIDFRAISPAEQAPTLPFHSLSSL